MKHTLPLTDAQRNELRFIPPDAECLPERDAATAANLRGCVIFIREKSGRGYWYYLSESRAGTLYGYRRAGGKWVRRILPLDRVERYY